jgi:hypothetical protein
MKTLAWLPCTVELVSVRRVDEHTVHANVITTQPGGVPARLTIPLQLRDNFSKGDDELIFMSAVSHLQADFRIPPPAPSFAAKEGTGELKSSV